MNLILERLPMCEIDITNFIVKVSVNASADQIDEARGIASNLGARLVFDLGNGRIE